MIKTRVCRIRREYKNCCGEKIRYILLRDHGDTISVSTVYRILGENFVLRSKWKKLSKRGYVRRGEKPRSVLQTDTVDFGSVHAFTVIDTFTKEAHVVIRPRLTSHDGKIALKTLLRDFSARSTTSKETVDQNSKPNGKTTHEHVSQAFGPLGHTRKNEQAFIERFNGILRKECLGHNHDKKKDLKRIQQRVNEFLAHYHTKRPHLSLGMLTPSEFATHCRI